MGRVIPVLVVALMFSTLTTVTGQEPDPGTVGDTLRPIQEQVVDTALPPAEETTGDDLHSEEIAISADIKVTNIEYQMFSILFGGGKVQGDLRADLSLDFYAVTMDRLDDAVRSSSGNDNASVSNTFGVPTHRAALTAEEIRVIGAGALLEAFQAQQENMASTYVTDMLPGLRILGLNVVWSNTAPASDVREIPADPTSYEPGVPSLRDPPIRLDVKVDLQYLDRLSLYDIMAGVVTSERNDDGNDNDNKGSKGELADKIREEQSIPFIQKGAFEVLGINQLLNLQLDPGWSLDIAFEVPTGFTIEAVTDELSVTENKQTAKFYVDGSDRSESSSDAGIVTVSNRFLVTTILSISILILAGILRAVTELGALATIRRRRAKHDSTN